MAGAGYKLYTTGDVLSASDVNTYLQQQTVMVFASAAARTSALASVLAEGMVTYLKDTDVVEIYTGAAWVSLDDPNAIQNSLLTTTGDTIYASSASTPVRLGIGSTGQVLTVASGVPSWATPAGGSFTTGAYNNGAQQSTTSTSYVSLATTDAITVTTGTKALVSITSGIAKTGSATPDSWVSFAVSGATTLAAANNPYGIQFQMSDAVGGSFQFSGCWVVTGLTAGSNTFTMKFKDAGGGTTYFNNRSISIVNLGS